MHTFHFETKGAPALDEQVVVKPGEKNRLVTVTFATPEEPIRGGVGEEGGDRHPIEPTRSGPPIAAYVVGGLGLVALGAALYIDLGANSDARNLRDTCAPRCQRSDVDSVQQKYTIAGVTAGIGGALLVTGVVLLIIHNRSSATSGKNTFSSPQLLRF